MIWASGVGVAVANCPPNQPMLTGGGGMTTAPGGSLRHSFPTCRNTPPDPCPWDDVDSWVVGSANPSDVVGAVAICVSAP